MGRSVAPARRAGVPARQSGADPRRRHPGPARDPGPGRPRRGAGGAVRRLRRGHGRPPCRERGAQGRRAGTAGRRPAPGRPAAGDPRRAHRRAVRQAAFQAARAGRRADPAGLSRRHGQRPRGPCRAAPGRSAADSQGLCGGAQHHAPPGLGRRVRAGGECLAGLDQPRDAAARLRAVDAARGRAAPGLPRFDPLAVDRRAHPPGRRRPCGAAGRGAQPGGLQGRSGDRPRPVAGALRAPRSAPRAGTPDADRADGRAEGRRAPAAAGGGGARSRPPGDLAERPDARQHHRRALRQQDRLVRSIAEEVAAFRLAVSGSGGVAAGLHLETTRTTSPSASPIPAACTRSAGTTPASAIRG
ncbi:phenazine biosynthesis protein PhzC [Pseudomonas aeruginosa]|nr:phenazine biosynthesis protein PhzC [Pseudomonas aeruginosa]